MRKLALTLSLLLVTTAASAAELAETIDRTFDVRPGAEVVVSNVNGGITIKSWDQPKVRVIAKKEVNGDRDELREALSALKVDIQQRDGGLVVVTRHPKNNDHGLFDWLLGDQVNAQVGYELTVPRTMNLDLENTNGSIKVTEVDGQIEVETTNGKIRLDRCAGAVDASTTNGGIYAELKRVNRNHPLEFSTTNGRIEVELPTGIGADLDASTTNGSIESDLPVSTTRIRKNSLRGQINGGGTQLRMRTTNGGIQIRTAGS